MALCRWYRWECELGTLGFSPWWVFYDDGKKYKFQDFNLSATGNFFFNVELADYVDAGVAFNINYDRSYADGYLEAISNIRQGDIGLWTKIRAPFISDSSVFGLATQIDLYMPTEKKYLGLRPCHAWHIRGRGETRMMWLLLHYRK